jgi:hypothetical protein
MFFAEIPKIYTSAIQKKIYKWIHLPGELDLIFCKSNKYIQVDWCYFLMATGNYRIYVTNITLKELCFVIVQHMFTLKVQSNKDIQVDWCYYLMAIGKYQIYVTNITLKESCFCNK